MNLFNKKMVPDELPDLAMDELEKELKASAAAEIPSKPSPKPVSSLIKPSPVIKPEKQESIKKEFSEDSAQEKSFFADLEKDIQKEISNPDHFDRWYDRKLNSQDMVSGMRNYWDKQSSVSAMKIFGKNFKEKINEKISHLQDLERQWQNIYFDLMEKEEELREEEKELKKLLAEFVEACKKKKQEINNRRK